MLASFGNMHPAHETRAKYDRLKQIDTVSALVCEMKGLVTKMSITPFASKYNVVHRSLEAVKKTVLYLTQDAPQVPT